MEEIITSVGEKNATALGSVDPAGCNDTNIWQVTVAGPQKQQGPVPICQTGPDPHQMHQQEKVSQLIGRGCDDISLGKI
jgi:hypothetical protein